MVPVSTIAAVAVAAIGKALVAALWKAYKSKIVLGGAIFGFSVCGIAMVIGSRAVTGWNQTALLGFGTSFLIVGTVELGILGVLKKIIEPDRTSELIKDLGRDLAQRFTELEDSLGMTTSRLGKADDLVNPTAANPATRPLDHSG
jgi:hypothetical protein